jgi:hypothetical protein
LTTRTFQLALGAPHRLDGGRSCVFRTRLSGKRPIPLLLNAAQRVRFGKCRFLCLLVRSPGGVTLGLNAA